VYSLWLKVVSQTSLELLLAMYQDAKRRWNHLGKMPTSGMEFGSVLGNPIDLGTYTTMHYAVRRAGRNADVIKAKKTV
jgi:hypothetical protein